MRVRNGLAGLANADMVIVPSWKDVDRAAPTQLTDAPADAYRKGRVIVGLCLGAFAVAQAGLLDGRSATTHWAWGDLFAERFPAVTLDSQVLYIDHGDVVTSAGTAAGLDCCLHLLRKDLGTELANRLSKRLVIPPHRQGGQAQYVEQPLCLNTGADRIASTLEWIRG